MPDRIEKLGNSVIQHGKYNDRIYLMKMDPADAWTLPQKLDSLAESEHYTKIFAKVPISSAPAFQKQGFAKEAFIPGFYRGNTPAYFMSKFPDRQRASVPNDARKEISDIIKLAKSKYNAPIPELPDEFRIKQLEASDISKLTSLYSAVFKTYPFPIFDDAYIAETMGDNFHYFGVFRGEELLSASSSETDPENRNVEMTDFATHPDHTGHGFAVHLLIAMEKEMKSREFLTAFTIARAFSHGMNITFAKCGYEFSGTLINNTNINGQIESMNVWYKKLG